MLEEGPRVYIERINVRGNTRTKDYVIRREFDIAEGDAYNRALIDRAERRLKNLDYFKTVKIINEPGSSADRIIIVVDIEEKSTGDFSVSGGYSTADGFMGEVSVSERNLLGTGLYAKARVPVRPARSRLYASIVEPFLLGYRVAGGLDFFQAATAVDLRFVRDEDDRRLGAARFCASRRPQHAGTLLALQAGSRNRRR